MDEENIVSRYTFLVRLNDKSIYSLFNMDSLLSRISRNLYFTRILRVKIVIDGFFEREKVFKRVF